jgi:peptide/nickel transport system substrate-binding protein
LAALVVNPRVRAIAGAPRHHDSGDALLIDRRRFLVAGMAGAGALALAACGSPRSSSGAGTGTARTVRTPFGAIGFPSPFAANADIGYNQMSLLYDTLLWKDGSGTLLPWLARSFEGSADHLRYTFELREGVRWSDGRPLTSADVVFTFDYFAAQRALSPAVIIQPPAGIADVKATGPLRVEITLERPLVTFLEQVAGALPILPEHVWSKIDDPASQLDRKVLVGTGPYTLESYRGDSEPLLFAAKDDYFLGAPYVKRVEGRLVEGSAQFAGLLSGEIDTALGFGLRDDILAPFQRDDAYGIVTDQGGWVGGNLYFNLGKEGPLSDARFRRACAMAIDRNDMVSRLASGRGLPGNPGFLSPKNPFFAPVVQYDLDVAGANALLDAAGYRQGSGGVRQDANGNPLSFELRFDNAEVPMSELLIASLRRIGVEGRAKPVDIGPELFGTKLFGGYDMVVLLFPGPTAGGPNADPDLLRRLFSSRVPPSLTGATNYANPAFDELAEAQQVTFDEAQRRGMVAEMQRMIAADLPVLPLYYPDKAFIFRREPLDQWYFTPGQYPTSEFNKQLFVTGQRTGTSIRPSA